MRCVSAVRAWLCCVALGAAACGISDVEIDALTAKLRDDCQIAPVMPRCCAADEACVDYAYERFLRIEAGQAPTRDCLRALDCAAADRNGAVHDCLSDANDELRTLAADCLLVCTAQLSACGAEFESCTVGVAASCFSDNDRCRSACFASL